MESKKKFNISGKLIFNITVFALSIGLITYFIFSKDGLRDFLKVAESVSWLWISAAIFLQLFNVFIDILIIYMFIKPRYKDMTFRKAIKIGLVGTFFNAVTPASSGGQPMQIYLMSKMNMDVGFSSSVLVQKFLIFLTTSFVSSIFIIVIQYKMFLQAVDSFVMWLFVAAGIISQLVIVAGVIIATVNERLTNRFILFIAKCLGKIRIVKNVDKKKDKILTQLKCFHDANKELYSKPKLLIVTYALVVMQCTAIYSVVYCVYRGLGLNGASLFDMISAQAIVNIISSMIPLPGASGAAELSFSMFFSMFFTAVTIKSAILLWRFITYYAMIVITAPFSFLTKGVNNKLENVKQPEVSDDVTKSECNSSDI